MVGVRAARGALGDRINRGTSGCVCAASACDGPLIVAVMAVARAAGETAAGRRGVGRRVAVSGGGSVSVCVTAGAAVSVGVRGGGVGRAFRAGKPVMACVCV